MTWWQVKYIGPFSLWKGQHFALTSISTYFGYVFAFIAHNVSVKTTICGLTDGSFLFSMMGFHVALLLMKQYILKWKKCGNTLMFIEFIDLTAFLAVQKQIDRKMKQSFENIVTAPAICRTGTRFFKSCICFESLSTISYYLSYSQGLGIKAWKWEWCHSPLTPVIH